MRIERACAAVLLLLAGACLEKDFILPTANELLVHGVLDAERSTQDIIVQETNGSIAGQRPVTGAAVTLTAPDGRVATATEVHDSTLVAVRFGQPKVTTLYRLSLAQAGMTLVPGGTYALKVVYQGHTVTGSTIVPALANAPLTLAAHRDTLHVSWNAVSHAYAYEVSVTTPTDGSVWTLLGDTLATMPGDIRFPFDLGVKQSITVTAVDRNYYDYFRRSSDTFTGAGLISHLSGGLGVFGSVARVTTQAVNLP